MNTKPISYFTRLRRQPKVDAVSFVASDISMDTPAISQKPTFVVAYLMLHSTNTHYIETLAELFTAEHAAFDYHVASNPLFFKFEEALQYLRFMGDSKLILKAIIPHTAVEGRFETLHVRTELLKIKHIYGGYTSAEANHFVINPCFDASILPLVKTYTVYDE
jgi:hypothetical protein